MKKEEVLDSLGMKPENLKECKCPFLLMDGTCNILPANALDKRCDAEDMDDCKRWQWYVPLHKNHSENEIGLYKCANCKHMFRAFPMAHIWKPEPEDDENNDAAQFCPWCGEDNVFPLFTLPGYDYQYALMDGDTQLDTTSMNELNDREAKRVFMEELGWNKRLSAGSVHRCTVKLLEVLKAENT